MSAQTISITPGSTNAAFKAWGSAISAAIAAAGLVQTADSGQINWTTYAATPASNAAAGYEVWRFNDSLQSTAPVFIKLEYGLGSNSYPQMWMTIGTGSDGAGNITGTYYSTLQIPSVTPRTNFMQSGTGAAVATTSYINSDGSTLMMLLFPNNSTAWAGGLLLVERTRDATGAATGDGLLCLFANSASASSTAQSIVMTFLPGTRQPSTGYTWTNGWPMVSGPSASNVQTCMVNGTLYPLQVFTGSGPKAGNPSQYVMAVGQGDVAGAQVISVTHYGTARNFYTAGMGATAGTTWWGFVGLSGGDLSSIRSFIARIN